MPRKARGCVMEPFRCAEQRPPIRDGSSRPGSTVGRTFPLVNLPQVPLAPCQSVNLFQGLCQRHTFKFGCKDRRERNRHLALAKINFSRSPHPCLTEDVLKLLPPV